MGDTKWTKEQQLAIDTRNCNLLVAAAAGSGKTAVLVERIIKIITNEDNPTDIDKLLIVTFTNAAAAEMRERIGDAISKALDKAPESKDMQRQLTLLNKASITTIHSFCLQVIRNNFHKIDLDPNFRIADATEAVLLKNETLLDMFEDKYSEIDSDGRPNKEFLRLVESYGGSRDDEQLQRIVLGLYEFVMSGPWPDTWLKEAAEAFNVEENFDFGASQWGEILRESLLIELSGLNTLLLSALNIINSTPGLEAYLDNIKDDINIIQGLKASCNGTWSHLHEAFSDFKLSKLKTISKKAEVDKLAQEKVKAARDDVKKRINKIVEDIFISSPDEINKYLCELYPMMSALSSLVMDFDKRYKKSKKERGILDFNDLEHLALNILTTSDELGNTVPSEAALALREHFEEILVDEYQDSNNVQEVILNMISRKFTDEPNVFMVGDVKQSIYRFRQAEPGLFLEKYETYSDKQGDKNRKITLYKNFRSREEVIDSVNYIFKLIMSHNIGELEYTDVEALNLGANFMVPGDAETLAAGPTELHLIEKIKRRNDEVEDEEGNEDNKAAEEEDLDNIRLEARMVAKRIKELMTCNGEGHKFKVYDKSINAYRSVKYKDIVILLRATTRYAATFAEELTSFDIPVYADADGGYFETTEIKTMMSMLQIIDNPRQDIPLIAVLRSPVFSFTPEELIDIRAKDKTVSFYEAMKLFMASEELEDVEENSLNLTSEKIKEFIQVLNVWRNKALHMPIDELIWYLYSDTGYYGYAGAMPGGIQRQANLRILFERARQFEHTSYRGLFNFVNFIDKLRTSSGDMGSAKILGENEDVVRIMSIHKSKGLEFPIVIAAGCGKNFNMMDMNRSILFHQKLGVGPNYVDPERRISYQTIFKQAIKNKIKIESLSEEMRVLYVAFTRAKEKLIITGAVNNVEAAAAKWCSSLQEDESKLSEYTVLKGKSYLDWIGPCLAKHRDGSILRELAGLSSENPNIKEDMSKWDIKLWRKEDIIMDEATTAVEELKIQEEAHININEVALDILSEVNDDVEDYVSENCEDGIKEEVYRRLNWQYEFHKASAIPTILTVTELKRMGREQASNEYTSNMYAPELARKPKFMEETKKLTAAERGTIMHSVMQHLDLKKISDTEIKEQVQEMIKNELLTEEQAKAVYIKSIAEFFKSPIGQRLLKAKKLKREMPFNIRLKSTEIYKELPKEKYGEEVILLQGVIDCFFEEDGELVLLDYKTDYASEDNVDEIKERYEQQLHYYQLALEKIMGKKVKEKYIYLLSNGMTVQY